MRGKMLAPPDPEEFTTMTRKTLRSRIGADGVLHLEVPLGEPEAGLEVRVTIEPLTPAHPMTREEWAAFLARTAGAWQGEFERPAPGEYETRDPLS